MLRVATFVSKNVHLVLVFGIVFFLYRMFKDFKKNPLFETEGEIDVPMSTKGSDLSKNDALRMANRLHVAMNKQGTDEDVVMEVLKSLNKSDYGKVYNAFGKRQYDSFWGESTNPLWSTNRDLTYWLDSELNESEKEEIKVSNPSLGIF